MVRTRFFVLFLSFVAAIDASRAQAVSRQDRGADQQSQLSGTWSARNSSGTTFMGTWTAVPDSVGSTVVGTWTLVDAGGRMVLNGAWSAAKSRGHWTGTWRARVADRDGEYGGTWRSSVDLTGDGAFVALFEKAAHTVVGGTWRAGAYSGTWSIRAAKREGPP